jgi:3-isopropylmalate/(R)-2-methylmalate dehydratase small subunit
MAEYRDAIMKPFVQISGAAIPMPMDDVNTDQIIPSAYLKDLNASMADGFMAYARRRPDGSTMESCVLEQAPYKGAPILLVGSNFGCGSSREHAVWALQAFGIRCVVGHRLAEFFRDNCYKNGVLPMELSASHMATWMQAALVCGGRYPFTVDLQTQQVSGPNGFHLSFEVPTAQRGALLNGLDDIGLTLENLSLIEAWEARQTLGPASSLPIDV